MQSGARQTAHPADAAILIDAGLVLGPGALVITVLAPSSARPIKSRPSQEAPLG